MIASMSLFRRTARWIGPVFVILMLGVVLLGALHHHDGLGDRHPCALCSAAHSPAVTGGSAPALGATVSSSRPIATPYLEPRTLLRVHGVASRAPPSA